MPASAKPTLPHIRIPRSLRWAAAHFTLLLAGLAAVGACAAPARPPHGWPETLQELLPADVILLGEQHDAPEHHAMERTAVQWLAKRRALSSVVIEMAPAGGSTALLGRHASATQARASLQWDERVWPWADYSGAVMAAVRAGIPVLGGNLPRDAMRPAMTETTLDGALPPNAYAAQLDAVREGHCDLLPESQLPGMVRVQIARDQRMAEVAAAAVERAPGKTVLVIAGNGHVLRSRGIPAYLPRHIESKVVLTQAGQALTAIQNEADRLETTPALPARDVCAPLRSSSAAQDLSPR